MYLYKINSVDECRDSLIFFSNSMLINHTELENYKSHAFI